ncbi:potassium channel subfamily K member 5-like [Osmerus eperlanus]|uniref:potassium channel subfamily K member 5-like n=1 Tax=Osmerus eperlanus TaxID=29151 RepID=UPI002E12B640
MADDKGPFLTSCIIFYLSIGAALFQILEQPNWELATLEYKNEKDRILNKYRCLRKEDLDEIFGVVSQAAGQGVTITGEKDYKNWDWGNSVIFAATIITTIGYGNVAPKTDGGRVFCILYGLFGIPLCLTWISELGSFFGNRAKRLSQVLIRKGQSVKMVQITCTMVFLLWGLLFHLVLPPLVFRNFEGWTYLEGLYFSFITLTTVGFGDYVAGVNPSIDYPRLYRVGVELWMYMGLAWLSLFFSWNVHMVVEVHKVFKKRRQRHRLPPDQRHHPEKDKQVAPLQRPMAIDIFNFLSEREAEDYSTVIKKIGVVARRKVIPEEVVGRSKSCSDLLEICTLEHSPRQRRRFSIGEPVFVRPPESLGNSFAMEQEEEPLLPQEDYRDPVPEEKLPDKVTTGEEGGCVDDPNETPCPANSRHTSSTSTEESVRHPRGGSTRFTISKVVMGDGREDNDENG